MKAVYAHHPAADNPLEALRFGEQPEPGPPGDDWIVLGVVAAALNHHDLWTLRGAGLPADRYPMILGAEGLGADDDGRKLIIHGMVCRPEWRHEPIRDPGHSLLSDDHPGTFAERVAVPRHSVTCPKPEEFSDAEAACLTGTWLTAYRMLFTKSGLRPGDTVLVQGAGGGVATALIRLAAAAGLRVWVTSRSEAKREAALRLGAHTALPARAPVPEPVDAVMESVGQATWAHSLRSVRPGGTIVVTGATTGGDPPAYLNRLFWNELRVVGSTSGTPEELDRLIRFMLQHDLRPDIAAELPFDHAEEGFRRMLDGDLIGKVVFSW
ncbi:D-arabinose 1-dehydrogenase, Zn-dependent alcohol dehydrogenase family [Nonomuraea solani]|uniref:D-arabinose 1-dehydrogenase, Zn-dependent alcohol dehydrogenase family n=1 Tax=Nonomuraea solani TaxID=1144553 RepID=A0A1H6ECI3_9ACTN|nr:zinc-binding dehydrogenase [Nonomuraea solani]SEG95462.1 D-arabinose 1-dehydrogenase, Zn-dependent alcohol dehydrogenase family [Nonomuraea solani]